MERWEWLIDDRIGIFQDPALGCFTEDSIRLSQFLRLHPDDAVLDLGTGNGVLCLYTQAQKGGRWYGIDTDAAQIALAEKSARRNGQPIAFRVLRVEDAPDAFGHGSFDCAVMNPPYFTSGDGGRHAQARHADAALLDRWCKAAFLVLNNGGTLTLCYPAEQLAALFRALDANRLAPKRTELILTDRRARLALVEAKKLGADGLVLTVQPDRERKTPAERADIRI